MRMFACMYICIHIYTHSMMDTAMESSTKWEKHRDEHGIVGAHRKHQD